MESNSKHQIRTTPLALDYAKASLGSPHTAFAQENETIKHLRVDKGLEQTITKKLHGQGLTHLINLTHTYDEAAISLVFYNAANTVTKIIPGDYFDDSEPPFSLPHISLDKIRIEDDCRDMLIAHYPWIAESYITKDELNEHEKVLNSIGLTCPPDDRDGRNFRRLPDRKGTIVAIDSCIYQNAHNGKSVPEHIKTAWKDYISELYPIYNEGQIPAPENKKDFYFKSLHNRENTLSHFDITKENPIVRIPEKPAKRGFWQNLFSPPDAEPL